jgi:hypothetical protein
MMQPEATSRRAARPNQRGRRHPPKDSTKVRATRSALGLGPNIAVRVSR